MKILSIALLLFTLTNLLDAQCVHDEMVVAAERHFYNDLSDTRLLAQTQSARIRIYVDYTQVAQGGLTQINTIKRAINITASYYANVLNVTRLSRLYYPKDAPLQCNTLKVPETYVTNGAIGDIGVMAGNQNSKQKIYVAKSIACAYLQSNKRPYWGIMVWNNAFLKYDQEGFQQMVYVGIHEMTHILGFSAIMYDLYPTGTPLIQTSKGDYMINTPSIIQAIKQHFKCNKAFGLPLQDQDGTLIASHWQRKVMGNQMMIASNRKSAFTSLMTLLLLKQTGWYTYVNLAFAEPTTWGKDAGCNFLDIDNCDGKQFCQDSDFGCDTDGTAIGRCSADLFTGSCKIMKYFTNTICVDQYYELKNLNSGLGGMERGGSNSRCFKSDYRAEGNAPSKLNQRCYISICSFSSKFMYLLIGSYIAVCRNPGQIIPAPPGLTGTLTCPQDFSQYCEGKKTCPYHCNKNGMCINGQCLCTGTTKLSSSCVDVSILIAPIGDAGGITNVLGGFNVALDNLTITQNPNIQTINATKVYEKKVYSVYSKCMQGTVEDQFFGGCLKCSEVFNCQSCTETGCLSCDDGSQPSSTSTDGIKRCLAASQKRR